MNEQIRASILFASYFETLGFKNGEWEFNYGLTLTNLSSFIEISNLMLYQYIMLGGPTNINISNWNSSDDTILIIATCNAIINNENYISEYIKSFNLLKEPKRYAGITTLESIRSLQKKIPIRKKKTMGGNGAAMRTMPIGLFWYNDIEKVIKTSIIVSKLTHNYYLGFLGGMVSALFTAFAINKISKFEWINKLLELYDNKIIQKYYSDDDLDDFINYWKCYQESRQNFIHFNDRIKFLLQFTLTNQYKNIGSNGLDVCIYAYDCLLLSDNLYSFMTLVSIHPGDNDTTGAIGGAWFGALYGFSDFDTKKFKQLEFYDELDKVLRKFIKAFADRSPV
uniref:ADP-ribosylglycohydrolase n=1 Tax=viral metagenome TaxID=1070528 RepID=A0A6C0H7N2_9ZZZZ